MSRKELGMCLGPQLEASTCGEFDFCSSKYCPRRCWYARLKYAEVQKRLFFKLLGMLYFEHNQQSPSPIGLIVAKIHSLNTLEISSFGSRCYSSKPKSPLVVSGPSWTTNANFSLMSVCVHFITTTLFSCRHTWHSSNTDVFHIHSRRDNKERAMRKRGREMGRDAVCPT